MKKLIVIFFLTLFAETAVSQNGFYLGYENGLKIDKFYYINSKGYSLTQSAFDGVWGAYVGYKIKNYTLETGFYGYYSSEPAVVYDYQTGKPDKTLSFFGSSDMNTWAIPFRFGYEFLFMHDQLVLKPEVSFVMLLARDYSDDQPSGGWGENVSPFPGDPNYIPTGSDSTRAYFYRPDKVNMGMEASLSFGYRIKQRADIYLKGTYSSSFNPLFYDTITHYSEEETVTATNTFTGNSFLFQIGLRFYFGKRDE